MKEITVQVNGRSVGYRREPLWLVLFSWLEKRLFRTSVSGQPRSPVCGMGICFECRVTIDDQPHQRACSRLCYPGMEIQTQ